MTPGLRRFSSHDTLKLRKEKSTEAEPMESHKQLMPCVRRYAATLSIYVL